MEDNFEEREPKKEIEVISGDGNLTISPVYEHLEVEKPKPKENRTIIVPEVKKDVNSSDNSNFENEEQEKKEVNSPEEEVIPFEEQNSKQDDSNSDEKK